MIYYYFVFLIFISSNSHIFYVIVFSELTIFLTFAVLFANSVYFVLSKISYKSFKISFASKLLYHFVGPKPSSNFFNIGLFFNSSLFLSNESKYV
jgi:hypothetical protein